MKSLPVSELKISPFFDLETYLLLSGQRRITGPQAREIEETWLELYKYLKAYRLGTTKGYLTIFLSKGFEDLLDQALEQDLKKGDDLQLIAQALIMATLMETVPEASFTSCAPVPEPNKVLKRSLAKIGLEFYNSGHLNVQFGILTRIPFKSDCQLCYIKDHCAKRIMEGKE